jgi:hypothetical protein
MLRAWEWKNGQLLAGEKATPLEHEMQRRLYHVSH